MIRRVTICLGGLGVAMLFVGCGVGTPCVGDGPLACGLGAFCKLDTGSCGDVAAVGECAIRPEVCTLEFAPVCGCDGVTYGNACSAAAAGANVDHDGACEAQVCGGIAGLSCDAGEFCLMNTGECCCDFTGVCMPTPDVCTEIFQPVCGCDGMTYANECLAMSAGVSVEQEGECDVAP